MVQHALIVEDKLNIAPPLEFIMNQVGFDFPVVADGEETPAAVAEQPSDIALLDIMIPKRNGYEIHRTIRGDPDWRDVRIIMPTVKGRNAEREKGTAFGTGDYTTKLFFTWGSTDRFRERLAGAN